MKFLRNRWEFFISFLSDKFKKKIFTVTWKTCIYVIYVRALYLVYIGYLYSKRCIQKWLMFCVVQMLCIATMVSLRLTLSYIAQSVLLFYFSFYDMIYTIYTYIHPCNKVYEVGNEKHEKQKYFKNVFLWKNISMCRMVKRWHKEWFMNYELSYLSTMFIYMYEFLHTYY